MDAQSSSPQALPSPQQAPHWRDILSRESQTSVPIMPNYARSAAEQLCRRCCRAEWSIGLRRTLPRTTEQIHEINNHSTNHWAAGLSRRKLYWDCNSRAAASSVRLRPSNLLYIANRLDSNSKVGRRIITEPGSSDSLRRQAGFVWRYPRSTDEPGNGTWGQRGYCPNRCCNLL
jgi:hypothetical protein